MIEVNLLPGGKKRAARGKRAAFALPKFGALQQDRWVLAAGLVGVLAVGAVAWLYLSIGTRREEADVRLAAELADSALYSEQMARTNTLLATRDTIVTRVAIIQEIDKGRYIWPHIMDEISRALPDYTWVQRVEQVTGGAQPHLRLVGQAGSIEALTVFMDQLEGSPFLRDVKPIVTQQALREGQLIFAYELELDYEQPPLEFLETVPLLPAGDTADAAPPGL